MAVSAAGTAATAAAAGTAQQRCCQAVGDMGDPGSEVSRRAAEGFVFCWREAWCSAAGAGPSPRRLGPSPAFGAVQGEPGTSCNNGRPAPAPAPALLVAAARPTGWLFSGEPGPSFLSRWGIARGPWPVFAVWSLQLHVCRGIIRLHRVLFFVGFAWNYAVRFP